MRTDEITMKDINKVYTNIKRGQYRKIYFANATHSYTDDLGNPYISATQLQHEYLESFNKEKVAEACEAIGKNPRHKDYFKYKGKTAKQLMTEWENTTVIACNRGNKEHDYLEDHTHDFTNYKKISSTFTNGRIYTIDDILENPEIGEVKLGAFVTSGIKDRYPLLYKVLDSLAKNGFRFYAEVTAYYTAKLTCGRIDLLAVKGDEFIILDWKTNKSPITFKAGYYEKDILGELTDKFIETKKTFKTPLNHLPASVGHKYQLQLSTYAYLVELFGLKCIGLCIYHLNPDITNPNDRVTPRQVSYLKGDVETMINDYYNKHTKSDLKTQTKLF